MLRQLDIKQILQWETVKRFPHNAGHEAEMTLCKAQFFFQIVTLCGEFPALAGDNPSMQPQREMGQKCCAS